MNKIEQEFEFEDDFDNELIKTAMKIIMHAGDARNNAEEAINLAKKEDFLNARKKMNEAKENIRLAHISQTKIIQNEMSGCKYDISLLFNHAQDTLMTIMSEVKIISSVIDLYELTVIKINGL